MKNATALRRHVQEASEFGYTNDLKGPLDPSTLVRHRRLIRDARENLGASFVQNATEEAFELLGFENDSQTWAQQEARTFRAMLRHVEQAIVKAKKKLPHLVGWRRS